MPRPPQATELAAARARRIAADAALAAALSDADAARRARDAAILEPGADRAAAQRSLDTARRRYDELRATRNALLQTVTALSSAAARADDDEAGAALYAGLEGDVPIAMFPVRLETRYDRPVATGPARLRIRIYPDEVNVQRHTAALTAAEQESGRAYWSARFAAEPPQGDGESADEWAGRRDRPRALWGQMVRALRAPRAAFVVERLRPTNQPSAAPGVTPTFPDVGAPGSRLAAQPVAVMLPDRFCAVGIAKGGRVVFRRFGAPVPDVLAAAPVVHPGDAPPPGEEEDAFGGEAAWIARYEAALDRGMGITVTQADVDAYRSRHPGAPSFTLDEPLERLVVLGVDWTLTPDEAADGVASLLESHAAAGGMAFLPIGTPTNNTGHASSGFSPDAARDPSTPEPTPPAVGTTAVEALRVALGLRDEALASTPLPHERRDDAELSRHMLNALYRALAGQFLEEQWADLHDPTPAERSRQQRALDAVRDHVVRFVRPAGPFQPIRVGMQPYGILPVTAAGRWQPADEVEDGIARVLGILRPSWEHAVPKVARFDGDDATTHRLLLHGPWAQMASYREVARDPIGAAVREQAFEFQMAQLFDEQGIFLHLLGATWGASYQQAASMATLGVSSLTFAPAPARLPAAMPWVQADVEVPTREAPGDAALAPDYVATLASTIAPRTNAAAVFAGMRQAESLLQGLLAYSANLEVDAASARVAEPHLRALDGRTVRALASTPRAVGLEPAGGGPAGVTTIAHAGELAHHRVPALTGSETLGEYTVRAADRLAASGEPLQAPWFRPHREAELVARPDAARHLASVKESLLALRGRTVGELNWALRTTLDAFDYRLDAWHTSLAMRRLARLRLTDAAVPTRRTGVHVGAWGVVEALAPDPAGTRESHGHLLAPSLRHAAAAAVLRSGYESNAPGERKPFALDLSSARVRAARDVLEGLAQGQSLAALLGYRFERGLRDAGLAQHVLTYRTAYPLRPAMSVSGVLTPVQQAAQETVVARDVTDGVRLLEDRVDAVLKVPAGAGRDAVALLVLQLAQVWDAVSDVAVSEGVYQLAQGNMERAAAALATLDKQAAPVEPQSVLSPREGVRYTQRVALLFDGSAAAPDGWPDDAAARAEPRVNRFVADALGDATRFHLTARVVAANEELDTLDLAPAALGLSPLALLMALDAPGGVRTDAQMGRAPVLEQAAPPPEEVSQLRLVLVEALLAEAQRRFRRPGLRVQVDERPRDGTLGLIHLEALLGLARRLVTQARPALRGDLTMIEGRFDATAADGDYPGADAAELDARAVAALEALTTARKALDDALAAGKAPALQAALRGCRVFGVPGIEDDEPFADAGLARERLADRARAAQAQLTAREEAAAEGRAALPTAPTVAQLVPVAMATLRAVFGRGFPVLPLFTFGPAAPAVQACLAAQPTLTAGRRAVVAGWLPKLARVRQGVDHLQALLLAREVTGRSYPSDRFVVLQSTARTGGAGVQAPWEQPWAALPEAWPDGPEEVLLGRAHQRPDLAVALLAPFGVPTVADGTPLAGIVCDDWSETVPFHTVTAGVAFHFDAPGARAPQTMLLAVPPRLDMESWSFEDVLATVQEALALSRIRLVRPAQLDGAVNLALPLNLIADAPVPDVPGIDLRHLAARAHARTQSSTTSAVWAAGKV